MIGFNEGSRQMVRVVVWDWLEIDSPSLKFVFGMAAFSPFCFCSIFKLLLGSLGYKYIHVNGIEQGYKYIQLVKPMQLPVFFRYFICPGFLDTLDFFFRGPFPG